MCAWAMTLELHPVGVLHAVGELLAHSERPGGHVLKGHALAPEGQPAARVITASMHGLLVGLHSWVGRARIAREDLTDLCTRLARACWADEIKAPLTHMVAITTDARRGEVAQELIEHILVPAGVLAPLSACAWRVVPEALDHVRAPELPGFDPTPALERVCSGTWGTHRAARA